MSETFYYCQKCGHNHRYDSKIGIRHIKYKMEDPTIQIQPEEPTITVQDQNATGYVQNDISIDQTVEQDQLLQEQPQISQERIKRNKLSEFIHGYARSYRNGVEKFGIWWKIFQLSIWSLALIFLITAAIIFIIYLPKIEMIYWELV